MTDSSAPGAATSDGLRHDWVVVMGVSGSGKSTIGAAVAADLGLPFVDGDDLHPPVNVEKMRAGHPLTDADRAPWLHAVGVRLAAGPAVVACSALRRRYRDRLRRLCPPVRFLALDVAADQLEQRMQARAGHFMPPALLRSQLGALEPLQPDESGTTADGTWPPERIIARWHAWTATNEQPLP